MNTGRTLTLFLAVLAGCTDPVDGISDKTGSARSNNAIASRVTSASPSAPARITNRFGMAFCLVAIACVNVGRFVLVPESLRMMSWIDLTVVDMDIRGLLLFGIE